MYPNPLKQRLKNGDLLLGTVLPAYVPHIVTSISKSGIDFMWIDTEHAPNGVEALGTAPILIRQQQVAPMIRVPWNDPALIKKAFDIGAVAVMIPQVDTPEAAAKAVEYSYYPPIGNRGVSPYWAITAGLDFNEVSRTANEETVVVIQLESVKAYENIDEIKQIPGIDVIFVGPLDLSFSVGRPTEIASPEVQDIMKDLPKRLEGTDVVAGTTLSEVGEMQEKINWGYRYINVGTPISYGVEVLGNHLRTLRGE